LLADYKKKVYAQLKREVFLDLICFNAELFINKRGKYEYN
tara:strand:- start:1232 stop:1351 length:120 start_codon:yes stop_codon:yes gene_type:complete